MPSSVAENRFLTEFVHNRGDVVPARLPVTPATPNMAPEFGWAAADPTARAALEVATFPFTRIKGMHAAEDFQARPLRWTDGSARISAPLRNQSPPRHISLKLRNITRSPSAVTVRINGSAIYGGLLADEVLLG